MNWDHLKYFQKVALSQNFTLAAKELYITTAALSKAIHTLEKELGFPLFEKQGRNSVLTEYGMLFAQHVTAALEELDIGIQEVYNRVGLIKGHIKMSGNWTMSGGFLPERIKAFRTLYPEVTYFTKYEITSKVIRNVIDRMSDLGFCGDYSEEDENYSGLERTLLYTEELVIIVPKDHWMTNSKYVNFQELKNEDFISFRMVNAGGVYEAFYDLCVKHEFRPQIVYEAIDDHAVVSTVAAGLGVALVPNSKYLSLRDVVAIPFRENKPIRHQYVIWRKNGYLAPVAKAFRDFVTSTTIYERDSS